MPPETRFVGLARVGQDTQKIVAGTLDELVDIDFGAPLHSVIIVGETHELEDEVLASFSVAKVAGAEAAAEAGAGSGEATAEVAAGAGSGAGAGGDDAATTAAAKATKAEASADAS